MLLLSSAALAQDEPAAVSVGSQEIVVTGSRVNIDGYSAQTPAVGLKKVADFAIQPVFVTGDTRDANLRYEEMYQTIRRAIELSAAHGVQLAHGEIVVEPLTLANYRDLTFGGDGRPDTSRVELLVKAPLANTDARAATERIDRFIKAIKPVGRALVSPSDDLSLSVVAPDQYRPEIGRIIAADAAAMAARFGPEYAVEVRGLNRPVDWSRASLTEVFLYIPYELVIRPKS
ncbi:MAG TPA: TonB-dependent receptor [Sphingomicrobium sp.]|nr:TonB-dependent receptor [Sphingomicrobium sp.]